MAHPFKTRANSILASVMKVSKVDVTLHRVKRVRHIPTSSAVHREWVSLRRGFPTASPRARTEAGEWRRKPHVKVPSPRTAARRMSPRPFHGARQIGGRDAARTPYGFPHGRRTREARAARRMSLRTFYGARQIGGRDAARTPYGFPHGRRTREARAARRMSLRTFYGARQGVHSSLRCQTSLPH